mmetsp:Transcript_7640/g.14400  ORF Transcript_7640/g.14400 Transcript_7640/m.14400 type:complete len:246 (-) Transcript_7640:422-1159(-)
MALWRYVYDRICKRRRAKSQHKLKNSILLKNNAPHFPVVFFFFFFFVLFFVLLFFCVHPTAARLDDPPHHRRLHGAHLVEGVVGLFHRMKRAQLQLQSANPPSQPFFLSLRLFNVQGRAGLPLYPPRRCTTLWPLTFPPFMAAGHRPRFAHVFVFGEEHGVVALQQADFLVLGLGQRRVVTAVTFRHLCRLGKPFHVHRSPARQIPFASPQEVCQVVVRLKVAAATAATTAVGWASPPRATPFTV